MSDGDITLTPLKSDEAWQAFHAALCADMKLYDVATGYARVIAYESLQEYVQKGWLCAWEIVRDGERVGYGIYSAYTGTHDVYVYRFDGAWDPELTTAGLELLTAAVFEKVPDAARVFTYLPLPLPPGAEEQVLDLGFDPWENNREHGVKRTFAIERATWIAYHPEN